jgi:3-oxoacyl-[acyl-carrier protein] reductase
MDVRLDGKVVLVTGGAGGFGRAYAKALGESGGTMAVADVSLERAQRTADEIRAVGGTAEAYAVDLRSAVEVQGLMQAVVDRFGGLDVLVNVAGDSTKVDLKDLPEDDWDRVIDVNLKGIYLACKAAIPHLIARGGGRIINMGSNRGLQGSVHGSHYAASKGGVLALSRSLAQEVAPFRISVNALAPGATDTPMLERNYSPEDLARRRASGLLGQPEDFSPLVVLLASDYGYIYTGMTFLRDITMPR